MTEKEKAKAYDEAIERAKKLYGNGITEEIFPELKESDDDRIKKAIIEFFESEDDNTTYSLVRKKDIIAWLEKQGEQKPTLPKWKYKKDNTPLLRDSIILNKYGGVAKSPSGAIVSDVWVLDYDELAKLPKEEKIEPKFKVGDWIIFITSGSIYQVEKIENYEYTLRNIFGGSLCLSFSKEELIREWTIQDGKDGDILAAHECYVVFKEIDGLNIKCHCTYHYLGLNPSFYIDTLQNKDAFLPATKEQRDALMKAIKDAGYEWDAEKKELRKLVKY